MIVSRESWKVLDLESEKTMLHRLLSHHPRLRSQSPLKLTSCPSYVVFPNITAVTLTVSVPSIPSFPLSVGSWGAELGVQE